MPELPDIVAYIHALESRIVGQPIQRVRLASPFLLRTAEPSITEVEGHAVRELRRIGKRIAIGVEGDLWLALPTSRTSWFGPPPGSTLQPPLRGARLGERLDGLRLVVNHLDHGVEHGETKQVLDAFDWIAQF